jgi:translation elongation factor EF-Tu-like GTPase
VSTVGSLLSERTTEGILLQGVERDQVSSGMVLAATGSVKLVSRFRGSLCPLSKGNTEFNSPSPANNDVQLLIRTASVQARMANVPRQGNESGDQVRVDFILSRPTPIEEGQRFAVVAGEQLLAVGSVEEVTRRFALSATIRVPLFFPSAAVPLLRCGRFAPPRISRFRPRPA